MSSRLLALLAAVAVLSAVNGYTPRALDYLNTRNNAPRANLVEADLYRGDIEGADLNRADLSRADMSRANLRKVNFRGANLTKAVLFLANLEGADLTGADLTGADFEEAVLSGAKFAGAILTGAILKGIKHSNQPEILAALTAAGHRQSTQSHNEQIFNDQHLLVSRKPNAVTLLNNHLLAKIAQRSSLAPQGLN